MTKVHEVDLTAENLAYINDLIARGVHKTVDEVVADALNRLRQRDASEKVARAVKAPTDGDYRQLLVPSEDGER